MPWPFKKKKKKQLPLPPSFSKQDDPGLPGPPRTPPPLPTKKKQVLEGPPRQQQGLQGPPRQQPERDVTSHPNLPPPPPIFGKVSSQPPLGSQQPEKAPVPLFDEELTSEIHAELRQKGFGSAMKKAPERKAISVPTEDLTKSHFRESKQEYIEAGNKHLELNFYDNAATNYSCAILCDLIGEGWQTARRTMSNLSSGIPSEVVENNFFDNVRLLLEAIRTKNFTFLSRAEKFLKKNIDHLYPEDVAMVEKAINTARAHFGY